MSKSKINQFGLEDEVIDLKDQGLSSKKVADALTTKLPPGVRLTDDEVDYFYKNRLSTARDKFIVKLDKIENKLDNLDSKFDLLLKKAEGDINTDPELLRKCIQTGNELARTRIQLMHEIESTRNSLTINIDQLVLQNLVEFTSDLSLNSRLEIQQLAKKRFKEPEDKEWSFTNLQLLIKKIAMRRDEN